MRHIEKPFEKASLFLAEWRHEHEFGSYRCGHINPSYVLYQFLYHGNMETIDEFIENFRRAYFEEFGEEITREEAYDSFFSLVDVLKKVLKPRIYRHLK